MYLVKNNKRHLELAYMEWELMGNLIIILEPFESATKQMCCDSSSIAMQLPIARMLYTNISLIDDPFLDDMKVKILELIMEKFNVEDKKYFFPFWA